MTGRRLVAASESAPSEADPSHDCAEGAVSEAGRWRRFCAPVPIAGWIVWPLVAWEIFSLPYNVHEFVVWISG